MDTHTLTRADTRTHSDRHTWARTHKETRVDTGTDSDIDTRGYRHRETGTGTHSHIGTREHRSTEGHGHDTAVHTDTHEDTQNTGCGRLPNTDAQVQTLTGDGHDRPREESIPRTPEPQVLSSYSSTSPDTSRRPSIYKIFLKPVAPLPPNPVWSLRWVTGKSVKGPSQCPHY